MKWRIIPICHSQSHEYNNETIVCIPVDFLVVVAIDDFCESLELFFFHFLTTELLLKTTDWPKKKECILFNSRVSVFYT